MHAMTDSEARNRLDELIEQAQRGPIRITRRNRVVSVMISAEDHIAICNFRVERLSRMLAASANEAAEQGMTDLELEKLLSDEG